MEILSKKNCHRAARVRLIEAPENGVYEFGYRAVNVRESMMHTEFGHLAKFVDTEIQVRDVEMELSKWEVVSWKYDFSFECLYNMAVRAFYGTSFSPEERALQYIREYESLLLGDLEGMPKEEHEAYIDRFRGWVETLFAKRSRIVSVMITGAGNFPNSRNQKANDSYGKALDDFDKWRQSYAKQVAKRAEAAKSPEQKADEEWQMWKKDIDYCAETCKEIDNGECCTYRSAFTNSIFGKIERLANNGRAELVLKALDYIKEIQEDKEFGLKKPLFTQRHQIWKLQELCEKAIQAKEARGNRESVELEHDDARIVKNFADDRLQIFHASKPSADVISRLKSHGFKWSRFNGCWQRQLTQNAYYGAARVFFGNNVMSEECKKFLKQLQSLK